MSLTIDMLWLYFVTPTLGLLRNYVKYKQLCFFMYMRTPLVYLMFHIILFINNQSAIVYKSLIFERWFWFLVKTYRSLRNDDYHKKRLKYSKKYNLSYGDDIVEVIKEE